ncbi:MAG: leucine-rich repeat domain-containing protein, partial [Coriobacteriales bacterium]|nr:leucine-rich repeat domain-containing protein [Coriobacteriales bacterium]
MVRVLSALLIIVLCTPWTLTGCFPAADYYFKSTRIDDSNFPDDNFRNFLLESKYNEDGFLEARALFETSLDVSSRDIRDLKGIEHFPNLTSLDCSDNQLAALDVNKNTELERLDCSNNQLVGLDLTSNPKLQRVYCSGNRLIEVEGLSDSVNSVSGLDQSITVPVKPDGRNGYVSFGSF